MVWLLPLGDVVTEMKQASEGHSRSGGGRVQGAIYVVSDNEGGTVTYTQCEQCIL